MRLVTVHNIMYRIITEVDPNKGYSPEQVKDQYSLADTILNSNGTYFIAMKIINAEYE